MATTTKSITPFSSCCSSASPSCPSSFLFGPRRRTKRRRETETMKPFFFDKESFRKWGGTKCSSVMMLKPFSSEIFRRIEDYRFAVMEAGPLTFLLPAIFDAMGSST
ncbi:hypothetical protein HPP92_028021 [Vanilla planifolia]|nr:hypothetical protein HPP92_028021 [Vanilla planifolia]